MLKCAAIACLFAQLSALPLAAAEIRELSQNEIRQAVASGQSQDLAALLALVGENLQGELVDVRSFLSGELYFQVTLLRSDGSLVTVILNGRTGALLPNGSEEAKIVRAAAKANGASGRDGVVNPSGNGNAGGNGNGNSGGNGGGNGNGNGNGNGGNGNGNGGGNGNKN